MIRFVLRYGAPILLAIAPLLTYQFSLLDLLGYAPDDNGILHLRVIPYFPIDGPKPGVEMQLRVILTMLGIGLLIVSGYVDAYRPSRTLEGFRHDYLEELNKSQFRKSGVVSKAIRINVMYLYWRLHRPFNRTFEMVWRNGFEAHHRDRHVKMFIWQGVCGTAARGKESVFIDFRREPMDDGTFASRWLLRNKYRLFPWHIKKTCAIKALLSIPMIEMRGKKGAERAVCVGVINLDACTDAGANELAKRSKHYSEYFLQHGSLIAKMR